MVHGKQKKVTFLLWFSTDFFGQKKGAISLFGVKSVLKIYKIGRRGLNFCAVYCKTCFFLTLRLLLVGRQEFFNEFLNHLRGEGGVLEKRSHISAILDNIIIFLILFLIFLLSRNGSQDIHSHTRKAISQTIRDL